MRRETRGHPENQADEVSTTHSPPQYPALVVLSGLDHRRVAEWSLLWRTLSISVFNSDWSVMWSSGLMLGKEGKVRRDQLFVREESMKSGVWQVRENSETLSLLGKRLRWRK